MHQLALGSGVSWPWCTPEKRPNARRWMEPFGKKRVSPHTALVPGPSPKPRVLMALSSCRETSAPPRKRPVGEVGLVPGPPVLG